MGGFGSGRWSWGSRKTWVEECYKLSIFSFKPYLIPGLSGTWRWLRGEREIASIGYYVWGNDLPTSIRLQYSKKSLGIDFDYTVAFTTTPLSWGGVRYWFLCPLQGCNRRVGCLCLPPGGKYFGCRHCYDLSYESQSKWHRDKNMFVRLASMMQERCPGINWEDIRDILENKQPRHWMNLIEERYPAHLMAYDRHESYLTAEELCQQSGLTPENLKKLEDARLLLPDTRNGRYRPKLAGWSKKLAYLLDQGWELAEIKRWTGGRFKKSDLRQWPPEREDWQNEH